VLNVPFTRYWVPRSSLTGVVAFTNDKAGSGTDLSTESIKVNDHTVPALVVPSSFNSELAGYVKFEFDALDQWLEEQSQIIFHPRDPFHRVDVLPTGRRIQIEVDGVVLADTRSEGGVMSLWETNFPARWYLPRTAVCTIRLNAKVADRSQVNWEYLTESPTKTGCPYKGEASYYHAVVSGKTYADVVWWYEFPLLESALIQGMLCFYPDKVDMWVDGEKR
jgi:uncharacterized protein (DUF427 family)